MFTGRWTQNLLLLFFLAKTLGDRLSPFAWLLELRARLLPLPLPTLIPIGGADYPLTWFRPSVTSLVAIRKIEYSIRSHVTSYSFPNLFFPIYVRTYLRYERVDREGNFHTLWDESHKV